MPLPTKFKQIKWYAGRNLEQPLGTLIADERRVNVTNHKEALMFKSFALLYISATLLFSLFSFGVSYAFQIDLKKQAGMKGIANQQITQVSTTPKPCEGRDATACKKYRSMLR